MAAVAALAANAAEALTKCAQTARHRVRRPDVEEPDYWHRWLLCARRERPGRRGAAEKGDEFPPPCMSGKEHCEG